MICSRKIMLTLKRILEGAIELQAELMLHQFGLLSNLHVRATCTHAGLLNEGPSALTFYHPSQFHTLISFVKQTDGRRIILT